jgi:hypothetical protein
MPKPLRFAARTLAIVQCLYAPIVVCWLTVVPPNDQNLFPVAPGWFMWFALKDPTLGWWASA